MNSCFALLTVSGQFFEFFNGGRPEWAESNFVALADKAHRAGAVGTAFNITKCHSNHLAGSRAGVIQKQQNCTVTTTGQTREIRRCDEGINLRLIEITQSRAMEALERNGPDRRAPGDTIGERGRRQNGRRRGRRQAAGCVVRIEHCRSASKCDRKLLRRSGERSSKARRSTGVRV